MDKISKNAIGTKSFAASYHLNKIIEMTRVNLFTIVTQYRAIFNDDEHSPLSQTKNSDINQNIIFFGWIRNKVCYFNYYKICL